MRRCRTTREPRTSRVAFTVLELLAAVGVIALLLSLFLPAVQSARSSAGRIQCADRLRQLALAAQNFHSAHGRFPGHHARNQRYVPEFVPHLEWGGGQVPQPGDFVVTGGVKAPDVPAGAAVWLCPSDPMAELAHGHQSFMMSAGLGHARPRSGFLGYVHDRASAAPDVTDGLSQTAMLSERLVGVFDTPITSRPPPRRYGELRTVWYASQDHPPTEAGADALMTDCRSPKTDDLPPYASKRFGWGDFRGYNHLFTPNLPACYAGPPPTGPYTLGPEEDGAAVPPSSLHAGGVNVAFGDGRVSFTADGIDVTAWRAAGTISAGELAPW